MAYIGKEPIVGNFQKVDAISVVNGQAAYTLQVGSTNVSPESVNHMIVSLNGVIQSPTTAYTVSGATLTFASNLATGDVIDFVILLGNVLDVGTPTDNTVATAKIQDDAVTLAKMAAGTDGNIISYDASGNPVAIATGNDGQVLTSAGAGQPPAFEAAAGGAWTFIQAQTASDSGYIEWTTSQITSTYDIYKIFAYNVHSASDDIQAYVGVDVGAGYVTSNYKYATGAVVYNGTVAAVGSASASFIRVTKDGAGNATGEHQNYEFTIWDPLATDNWKMIHWHGSHSNQDGEVFEFHGSGGYFSGQAALSKLKFYMESGNITSGDFYLYGLNKS